MLTCISGCGGVIGCIVATSQLPAREKVRPAPLGWAASVTIFALQAKKCPKLAFYGVLGEFCTGCADEWPVLGEFCTGSCI